MRTRRLILIGFGSVHQALAHLLITRQARLQQDYGLDLQVVGVADRGGAIMNPQGLPLDALLAHKRAGHGVSTLPQGTALPDARTLARMAGYDLLLEASPVNLKDGEPALSCVRAALLQGKGVVLANKAPLVLDYQGLHQLAREEGGILAFSATVCGGLPVINVGQRDLIAADIHQVEGIFNSTSNYILSRMATGEPYQDALAEAQRRGLAERDPRLDVEGWDTANKLVIIANAVLHVPAHLEDVQVAGIQDITPADLDQARAKGEMIRLIATATREGSRWQLEVKPRPVPITSFLGGIDGWEMGVVFRTDIFEDLYMKIDERGPTATAAAMLRDVVNVGV